MYFPPIDPPVRDLEALRVFEEPSPGHARKQAAVYSLLQLGVPITGVERLIQSAPWPPEKKAKWLKNARDIAGKTGACPICTDFDLEEDCPVGAYLASPEARMTPMEVDLLG